jgi:hypothetical protein
LSTVLKLGRRETNHNIRRACGGHLQPSHTGPDGKILCTANLMDLSHTRYHSIDLIDSLLQDGHTGEIDWQRNGIVDRDLQLQTIQSGRP